LEPALVIDILDLITFNLDDPAFVES